MNVDVNMLSPVILHVLRDIGKQWAYMSTLLDLACFEAHAKDKQECSFYIHKMDSCKVLT